METTFTFKDIIYLTGFVSGYVALYIAMKIDINALKTEMVRRKGYIQKVEDAHIFIERRKIKDTYNDEMITRFERTLEHNSEVVAKLEKTLDRLDFRLEAQENKG